MTEMSKMSIEALLSSTGRSSASADVMARRWGCDVSASVADLTQGTRRARRRRRGHVSATQTFINSIELIRKIHQKLRLFN